MKEKWMSSEWVHNNFWKYQAYTKLPLVLLSLLVILLVE